MLLGYNEVCISNKIESIDKFHNHSRLRYFKLPSKMKAYSLITQCVPTEY